MAPADDLVGGVGYADDVESDGKSGVEAAHVVYDRRRIGVEIDLTVLVVRNGLWAAPLTRTNSSQANYVTEQDHNLGFKKVTEHNWLEPDPIMRHLVNVNLTDGTTCTVSGADWIKFVNDFRMSPPVPNEVRVALRFATGAIGYAYFYYPVFTIVAQQVLRVADFALETFVERLGWAHRRAIVGSCHR